MYFIKKINIISDFFIIFIFLIRRLIKINVKIKIDKYLRIEDDNDRLICTQIYICFFDLFTSILTIRLIKNL
jgi:hypothetical protein